MNNNYKSMYYYSKEDELFIAFAPELPGCFADGKTLDECLKNLDVVIDEWLEAAKEFDKCIPMSLSQEYRSTNPDILDVSKYILSKVGCISTMALEKLNYYCLVWSLVWFNREIFPNKFQAWINGPVCKDLFDVHKGKRVISENMISSNHILSDSEKRFVDCVLSVYGDESGEFLSELTHYEEPWRITRGNLDSDIRSNQIISNELIKEYYEHH